MRVKKSEGVRRRRGHKSLKVAAERSSLKVVVSGLRSQCQGCTTESTKDRSSRQRRQQASIYRQEYVLVKCKLTVLGKERE